MDSVRFCKFWPLMIHKYLIFTSAFYCAKINMIIHQRGYMQ